MPVNRRDRCRGPPGWHSTRGLLYRRPPRPRELGGIPARCPRSAVVGLQAASIRSAPMSPSNFFHTGFIASTQAWRCSGVSVRTTPPAAMIDCLLSSLTGRLRIAPLSPL